MEGARINHCHFVHSVDRNTLIAPPTGHCDGARGLSTFLCHMRSEGGCGCLPTCPQCKHGELFLRGESSSFASLRALTQAVLSLTRHLILLHSLAPFPRANPNLLCRRAMAADHASSHGATFLLSSSWQTQNSTAASGGAAAISRWAASTEQRTVHGDRPPALPRLPQPPLPLPLPDLPVARVVRPLPSGIQVTD